MPNSNEHPPTLIWINMKCHNVGRRAVGMIDSCTELTDKKTKFERLGP